MTPEEIKQARLELGLSRSQVAAILGTDTHHVRCLEVEARPRTSKALIVMLGWLMFVPLSGYWLADWPAG
jgi:DNA-binding transcriptional regulator YiaG